ncbi:hypothetical protein BDK51DRAFT_31138 [Blyttiomyces helicus]|uniref:Uncharacterized protein n=1 Tax=Blyttiomyces helicus TaxID=388810 RepID=A0A4P9W0F7_9FUNG|nr:hypothetical protein BDK51DRAFT_31138 [Blyttiomyces helicus]|eukprot:RKO84158.1 hypothetical protein BDK51DRAFT_31138 [Blyttiomyces helicus]
MHILGEDAGGVVFNRSLSTALQRAACWMAVVAWFGIRKRSIAKEGWRKGNYTNRTRWWPSVGVWLAALSWLNGEEVKWGALITRLSKIKSCPLHRPSVCFGEAVEQVVANRWGQAEACPGFGPNHSEHWALIIGVAVFHLVSCHVSKALWDDDKGVGENSTVHTNVPIFFSLPLLCYPLSWHIEGRLEPLMCRPRRRLQHQINISRVALSPSCCWKTPVFLKGQTKGWWLVLGTPDEGKCVSMRRIVASARGGRSRGGGRQQDVGAPSSSFHLE